MKLDISLSAALKAPSAYALEIKALEAKIVGLKILQAKARKAVRVDPALRKAEDLAKKSLVSAAKLKPLFEQLKADGTVKKSATYAPSRRELTSMLKAGTLSAKAARLAKAYLSIDD